MTRPVARQLTTQPQPACGQDCSSCAKADECTTAWLVLDHIAPHTGTDDCPPAEGATWK